MRDTGLERMMRDLRIFRIFEGTNDILRLFIALTGMKSMGKTLGDVAGLQKALKAMDVAGIQKGLGWLMDHNLKKPKMDEVIHEFQWVAADILMKYQKKIINPENQMMIKRLADTTISIYSMACVLSRANRAVTRGDASAEHELLMAQAWIKDQTSQCKVWLKEAKSNKAFHSDLTKISQTVVKNGTRIQEHPLGV